MIDTNKSLEQLENDFWPALSLYPTDLVEQCYKLRKVPVNKLSIENIRVLIGQNIGLLYIIPKALEILNENPFAEGDLFPGDLLKNVLRSDQKYWENNKTGMKNLLEIISKVEAKVLDDEAAKRTNRQLLRTCNDFKTWASNLA